MGKYGHKSKVSENLWDFNVCLLGESGVGKTTLMYQVCEKLVGSDGYMIFDCGKEDGMGCIDGASYETIPDFKSWNEVTLDIIKNKTTDYPDLKIIVTDTLDQLFEVVEPEAIKRWNSENIGKKDFVAVKTLNASWGGFGRGEEKVIEIILDRLWKLKSVGVAFWCCGHTKRRDVEDAVSGQTYSTLTTNMMQKYFNAIKTKMHVLGIACIDREIVAEKTGKKNIVTKKEETRNQVVAESRRIKFRDDSYSVDSKSRFANIVDEISLNAEEFIKALNDSIIGARKNSNPETQKVAKPKVTAKKEETIEVKETNNDEVIEDEISLDDETNISKEALIETIREKFKGAEKNIRISVKSILVEKGNGKLDDSLNIETLEEINSML